MANNYRKFNFQGCPNMFPKLIMLFIDHECQIFIVESYWYNILYGYTKKMIIINKEDVYHPNYHNWDTKIPKRNYLI